MSSSSTVKVSDYVMEFLTAQDVHHVFVVPGGAAMHLNDSLGAASGLEFVCNLHEQASSFAAETYGKFTGNLGVCMVTAGPGSTNAVTGVAGAWLDSTPCLFLSGQVKRADLKRDSGVRQLGVQEVDIIGIVAPITKYAVTVLEPESIRYHLEKAAYLARTGRPGPTWIDLPLDVQGAVVERSALRAFTPNELAPTPLLRGAQLEPDIIRIVERLSKAERPVVLIGNGARLAGAERELLALVEQLGVPVLATWLAHDLIEENHPLYMGRPGPVAPRSANFVLQNSDWMLAIGARLDLVVTGYRPEDFAREAFRVMVDVDAAELARMEPVVDIAMAADAKEFIAALRKTIEQMPVHARPEWASRCNAWKARYPVVLPEYRERSDFVSTYVLADTLSEVTHATDVIVSGSSGAGIEIFLLAYKVTQGQRVLVTTALGAMGYGLPASIGACLASGGRRTVLVDGDGGIQLNIQELETIRRLQLPIKMFIMNNAGYSSIRTSQQRYFGRLMGADATSGMTLPDIRKVAEAYGLPTAQIINQGNLAAELKRVLDTPGPVVCEVMMPPDEPRAPSLSSVRREDGSMVSRPLEDLWPFLDREEFRANMIIEPLPE